MYLLLLYFLHRRYAEALKIFLITVLYSPLLPWAPEQQVREGFPARDRPPAPSAEAVPFVMMAHDGLRD